MYQSYEPVHRYSTGSGFFWGGVRLRERVRVALWLPRLRAASAELHFEVTVGEDGDVAARADYELVTPFVWAALTTWYGATDGSTIRRTVAQHASDGAQSCLASLDGVTPTCLRTSYGLDNAASRRCTPSTSGLGMDCWTRYACVEW